MSTEHRSRFQKFQAVMARKPVLAALFILSLPIYYYGFTVMNAHVRTAHMERIFTRMAELADYSSKNFKGLETSEVYLQHIISIDRGNAPAEFKQALEGYITSYEASLAASKSGKDPRQADTQTAHAKQEMTTIYKYYQSRR